MHGTDSPIDHTKCHHDGVCFGSALFLAGDDGTSLLRNSDSPEAIDTEFPGVYQEDAWKKCSEVGSRNLNTSNPKAAKHKAKAPTRSPCVPGLWFRAHGTIFLARRVLRVLNHLLLLSGNIL